jgi:hypothetical protein
VGPLALVTHTMRLQQTWQMFVRPVKRDGWYETTGKLRGNATLDLMGWGGPIPRKLRFHDKADYADPKLIPQANYGDNRPTWFFRRFANQRWRKYINYLRGNNKGAYRVAYGKYLCRVWNAPGYKPNANDPGQLMSMEFKWHSEPVMWKSAVDSNGKETGTMDGMNSISLWNHSCFRKINKPNKEAAVTPEKVEDVKPNKVEVAKPKEVEDVEVVKPKKVEVVKPKEVEVVKPKEVEVVKPKEVEVVKPKEVEVVKPKELEVVKPKKVEVVKPKELEVVKPTELEVAKPKEVEVAKPKEVEAVKPKKKEMESEVKGKQ